MTIVSKPSQDIVIVACGANKFSGHRPPTFKLEETVKDKQPNAA